MAFFVKKVAENAIPDHFSAASQEATPATLALYEASAAGDLTAMTVAIGDGANCNWMCRKADGATSLHVAARNKNSKSTLEFLIGVGGHTGAKLLGNYNMPLHEAVGCGNDEGAIALMELGDAEVAAKNAFGNTPLFIAAKNANLKMVQYLLKKGHGIDLQNNRGSTILHLCASLCKENIVVGSAMRVAHGDGVGGENLPPPPNDNSVHVDPPAAKKEEVEEDMYVNIAAYLIKSGINLDLQDENGYSALHAASARGNLAFVEMLIDQGAKTSLLTKTNPRTNKGARTALQVADLYSQSAVVQVLERTDQKIASGLPVSSKSVAAKIVRTIEAKLRSKEEANGGGELLCAYITALRDGQILTYSAEKSKKLPVGAASNVGTKGKIGGQMRKSFAV